jgi:phage baseplate assembly protein W
MPYKSIEISNASSNAVPSAKQIQFYKGYSSRASSTFKLFDLDLIKQNIINTFNTRKGERVMNPQFGSIVWDILMEPMTPLLRELLNDDIKSICSSDPRVTPTSIKITEYPSGYIVEVTLLLVGTDQSTFMTLTFDQIIGLSVQ